MKNMRVLFLLLPALVIMFLIAVVPLITVFNYSLLDLFAGTFAEPVGWQNYVSALRDPAFMSSIKKQILFTFIVILIEIPLGIGLAFTLPKQKTSWSTIALILLGIPLLIPWNVVGIMWRVFTRPDVGLLPVIMSKLGVVYNPAVNGGQAWWTMVAMDVWHWTPLVILLSYAGLNSIPQEFYQAAKVDAASIWSTFRYITLPKLKYVLVIGLLLRVMDSFKMYDETFLLTAGGPGNATELLSIYTAKAARGSNYGFSSAVSLVYLFIVIVLCFILYKTVMSIGEASK